MRTHYHGTYLDDGDTEIIIEYTRTPYDLGRTSGPPEYCYPPEGGEVDIISMTISVDGKDVQYVATEEQFEKWIQEIECLPIEPDEPDWDYIRDMRREDNEFFERQGWND